MMYYINLAISYLLYPFRQLIYNPFAVLKGPKKLLNVSLPTRVALFMWLFLILLTIGAFIMFLNLEDRTGWENYWGDWKRVLLLVVLIVVIPIIVRQALKLWLEGEGSVFPDIDYAWKAGLDALKENGIDPTEVPIFVVLGNRDDKEAMNLFEASGLPLRVKGVPEGPAALHWFATPDAVYLCCTEASWLSLVAAGGGTAPAAPAAAPSGGGGKADIRGTMVSGSMSDPAEAPNIRDTAAAVSSDNGGGNPDPGGQKNPAIYGTLVMGSGGGDGGTLTAATAPSPQISIADANEQKARLGYVGGLLNRLRQPVCPINGILTLLPFEKISRDVTSGQAVQRSTKGDLTTLFNATKLRCAVIAVVTEMETESGFRELVRRVGPERAMANRFGKSFDHWSPPIPEQIEAVSRWACGAFEDWTYNLFRERDGLKKHGNTKLYSLLCKIRCHLTDRLSDILVDAYSVKSESESREALLFSGVYFVAAGDSEDRRAFVRAVFNKLDSLENELDWTEEALQEDDKYQNWANAANLVSVVMIVAMVGMFVVRYVINPGETG